MKVIIKFLILFFFFSINIIFTTCDLNENWAANYVFTGIAQECRWYRYSQYYSVSNMTEGKKIVIKDSSAHILYPDSYFLNYGATSNHRMDCEFTVEALRNNAIVVSIQQMNFDKQCSEFIQFTNDNGSLNKTICDKFVGNMSRSYPASFYLGKFNSDKYNTYSDSSKQEIFNADGKLKVKISVTEKNFQDLRYLFIAFTAIKRDASSNNKNGAANFSLATKYNCDGINNYNEAQDENNCTTLKDVEKNTDKKQTVKDKGFFGSFNPFIIMIIIFGCFEMFAHCYISIKGESVPSTESNGSTNNDVPVLPSTTFSNSVDLEITPDGTYKDLELPTYESLFPGEQNQAAATSAN